VGGGGTDRQNDGGRAAGQGPQSRQTQRRVRRNTPNISFNTKPAHGTVDIKPDRFIMGKGYNTGPTEACAGQMVDGVALWYTPAAGFHGVDQFSWTAEISAAMADIRGWTTTSPR
jgi:hypothetical protein